MLPIRVPKATFLGVLVNVVADRCGYRVVNVKGCRAGRSQFAVTFS